MGETIQQLKEQLNEYWQKTDKKKKKKIILITTIAILALIILSIVFTRTNYEVLYQNLSLKDVGIVTSKLDELGIKWKTPKDDTTTVLVPVELRNKAKIELASEGIPSDGFGFMDAFNDSSWTMTDYDKRERMKLALQNELASTISEIAGIEKATVYINEEVDTGFVLEDNKSKASASVFIQRN